MHCWWPIDDGKDLLIEEDFVVDYETAVLDMQPCAPKIGPFHFSRDVPALAVRATLRELKAEVGDKLRVPISYLLELTGGFNMTLRAQGSMPEQDQLSIRPVHMIWRW